MQKLVNNSKEDKWIRPWDREKFDYIAERDDRFFALVVKGTLEMLNSSLSMYGKPIKHFIFNTGSSYMYLEKNDYGYSWCETTGENLMYMETPRCVITLGSFSIPTDELTAPFARGTYERESNRDDDRGQIIGYNAEMQRLPIQIQVDAKYVFSTFNEALIFTQEIFENLRFQQYFSISYLGQIVPCSIEMNADTTIAVNNIDLTSKETNQKTMEFSYTVNTVLPLINERTEVRNAYVISSSVANIYKGETVERLGTVKVE